MQLVAHHLDRSKSVHERLQLLTFNSIIEANRLGKQASAIMAIAKSIEGISIKWSLVTEQARQAMQEIAILVQQTNQVMEVFSEASSQELRDAQTQARSGLASLQATAALVGRKAEEMNLATGKMQSKMAKIGNNSDLLDACSGRFDGVLAEIEGVRQQLEIDHPDVGAGCDVADAAQVFSSFYTTEMERSVLNAALSGTAVPVAQQTFVGNSVELF